MQKFLIVITVIVTVIVVAVGGLALKFFVIGAVKKVSEIFVQDVTVTDERVFFSPVFCTSADVMSRYAHRTENNILYIKIYHVLVGGWSKSHVDIKGDFSNLQRIVLEDTENEKVIWER